MNDTPLFLQDDFWPPAAAGDFLYPQWAEIAAIIDDTRQGADHARAWRQARDRWIAHTVQVLNERAPVGHVLSTIDRTKPADAGPRFPYCSAVTEHFAIIAPYKEDMTADISTLGEKFRVLAAHVLGPQLTADPPMGHVVLIFHGMSLAEAYLRPLGVSARAIAGVYLGGPFPHIVMHDAQRFHLRLTFLHELNHAVLHRLPIPLWIHEGLSRFFEAKLLAVANMEFVAERNVGRNKYWRENGLKDFWGGAVFHDSRARHGYVLAHKLIVRFMKSNPEAFVKFMLEAHRRDAGDAACRAHYGMGVLDMARDLLGPGEWEGPQTAES